MHVEEPLQLAVSHGPLALQAIAVPMQWPAPSQVSLYVQSFVSSQAVPDGFPSQKLKQFAIGVPWHAPFWQESFEVQRKPSSQAGPFGLKASAGHVALVPVHVSATSHCPAAARQTVPAVTKESVGHAALFPGQYSAMSQIPAEGRQTVVLGLNWSGGQVTEVPVQYSG